MCTVSLYNETVVNNLSSSDLSEWDM
jgi:hypothetical protein